MSRRRPRTDAAVGDHLTGHVDALAALEQALAQPPGDDLHALLRDVQQALQEAMDERKTTVLVHALSAEQADRAGDVLSRLGAKVTRTL